MRKTTYIEESDVCPLKSSAGIDASLLFSTLLQADIKATLRQRKWIYMLQCTQRESSILQSQKCIKSTHNVVREWSPLSSRSGNVVIWLTFRVLRQGKTN